jgi:hypothetical protein
MKVKPVAPVKQANAIGDRAENLGAKDLRVFKFHGQDTFQFGGRTLATGPVGLHKMDQHLTWPHRGDRVPSSGRPVEDEISVFARQHIVPGPDASPFYTEQTGLDYYASL